MQQTSPAQINPFVPLQASRKATKAKNIQQDTKKVAPPVQVVRHQKEKIPVAKPELQASSQKSNANVGSEPAVDKRKNRLAISFAK